MEIRRTPLPDRDQHFLDGAVDEHDFSSSTGIVLSLYGDPARIAALIHAPHRRGPDGFLIRLSDRREIARELEAYGYELLAQLPAPRQASIFGCGILDLARAIQNSAEFCSDWAFGDSTVGGYGEDFLDQPRCDEFFRPFKKKARRLHAPGWIARYVRRDDTVGRIRRMARRLLGECRVLPGTAPDSGALMADLAWQVQSFRAAAQEAHAGDSAYIGAPGYDTPTFQTHDQTALRQIMVAEAARADVLREREYARSFADLTRRLQITPGQPKAPPYRVIRQQRKVTKHAAVMAAAMLGASTVSAFARGEPVILPGQEVALRVTSRGAMHSMGHGAMAVSVLAADRETHLADLCVYIDKTPALDQLTAMALHMQAGLEAEFLATANIIRSSEAGIGHPLLRRDLAAFEHLQLHGRRAESVRRRMVSRLVPDRHQREQRAKQAYWAETRAVWLREVGTVVIGNDRHAKRIMEPAMILVRA